MSAEILFLAHRMPFPPDRGDKIRSSHILRHLAARYRVHAATFSENAADRAQESELARICASHCLIDRTKPLAIAGIEALLKGQPVSVTAFRSAQLQAYVDRILNERDIAAVYVFSGQMGQYVPAWYRGQLITDFVDVDSAKFEAYGAEGSGPRAWIDSREGRLLRQEEIRLAERSHSNLFVSAEEAELFRKSLPHGSPAAPRVGALRNGIDCALFDPATVEAEPRMAALSGPRLIFTGQMDYAPNIAAAERIADRLLPAIRRKIPSVTMHVVGRNPPASLTARHAAEGFHVWGEVPDIRLWLKGADLALVPLAIARGVQNKVLEAMAMGLPVVLTPGAATGIGGSDGVHFTIGESDQALVDAVVNLLNQPVTAKSMGLAARSFVSENMSWPAMLAPLHGLIDARVSKDDRRAA